MTLPERILIGLVIALAVIYFGGICVLAPILQRFDDRDQRRRAQLREKIVDAICDAADEDNISNLDFGAPTAEKAADKIMMILDGVKR